MAMWHSQSRHISITPTQKNTPPNFLNQSSSLGPISRAKVMSMKECFGTSSHGGVSVKKKLRIHVRTTTILYMGITSNSFFFPQAIII